MGAALALLTPVLVPLPTVLGILDGLPGVNEASVLIKDALSKLTEAKHMLEKNNN